MKAEIQKRPLHEAADLGDEEARKPRAGLLSSDPIPWRLPSDKKSQRRGRRSK
jgi:hypothetical protein